MSMYVSDLRHMATNIDTHQRHTNWKKKKKKKRMDMVYVISFAVIIMSDPLILEDMSDLYTHIQTFVFAWYTAKNTVDWCLNDPNSIGPS